MAFPVSYTIYQLGETSLTLELENRVDEKLNKLILQLFSELQSAPLPGMIDVLPAYSSLTIYYDLHSLRLLYPGSFIYYRVREELEQRLAGFSGMADEQNRLIEIPACYHSSLGTDLETVALEKGITTEQVIRLHSERNYRVYMIGFLPGFPYMGIVNEKITMPRKQKPAPVKAGSIGLAGNQTGIYPLDSPGGWQIIGRTPLKLFDPNSEDPVLLKPGDTVKFKTISLEEYYGK